MAARVKRSPLPPGSAQSAPAQAVAPAAPPARPDRPSAVKRRACRPLPIRSSPLGTAPSLRSRLEALRDDATGQRPQAARAGAHAVAVNAAPLVRKPILEEFEARLLLSADLNPLASDAVLAPPATVPAEFRSLRDIGLPSVVTSVQVAPLQRTHEIVFVDTSTPDYAELVAAMRESAPAEGRRLEFVLIDAERDGIRKITDTLAQKRDLDAIHIISHATDGAVRLGAATLDFDTLVKRAGAVKKWGDALTEQGDILFYGCDLAATQEGKSLMDAIARLTGADVAASENPTGAAALGGDWDLEFSIGSIESALAVPLAMQQSYGHVLAPGISVHAQAGAVFAFESGADARIEVVLTEAPTANVTIPVSSSNAAQMTVSAASLVFTPLNWNVAQTLVASAVNDAIAEGDLACTVVLGAAVSGDAAYNGLDPADVVVTVIDDDNTRIGGSNLIAYYLFDEPSGTAVLDKSNNGPALDLTMNTAEGSGWNRATAGAIQVTGNDVIAQSAAGPHKVYSRIVTAQQFTVEAWVQSSTLTQPDSYPHRLVTLSANPFARNFTLGVTDSDETPVNAYVARVRTDAGDGNGTASQFFTGANTAGLGLTHVALTVDSSGNRRLYVNGTLSGSVNAPVTYASWDSAFRLALFNELTLDRDWLGTMHLAAIYDRALTATEVQRNYTAGANENTLIVDTTLDVIDGDVSSIGALLQNKGSGTISLREAITAANNTALVGGQAHRIFFNLPGAASSASPHVITLSSALPNISRAMLIDGWSEPDFTGTPVIVLDGNASVGNGFTLTATADGSMIRGFVIRDFNDDAVVDNGIDGYGVYIQAGSDGNTIAGNHIGRLEADGTAALVGNHNRGDGIRVDGANNVIGGNSTVDRNIIAGNAGGADNDEGILVRGNNNQIVGNWIGIDGTGAALANGDDGIDVKAGSGTLIRNNVIAGNTNDGIVITGGAGSVTMQGNRIGVNAAGTIVANGQSGILVEFGAIDNVIGGIAAGEGNVIAGNGANGVTVTDAASRAAILQNAIYANTGLGINLAGGTQNGFGVTANDGPGDADTGPNALQNYPVLSSVVTNGTNATIAGTINVNNGGSFRIEFFANAVPAPGGDPSGHGEGGRYIGALQITDNGAGDTNAATGVIAFSTTFAAAGGLAAGELVTATATRTDASFTSFFETSEFAQNVAATSLNSPPAAVNDSYSVDEDSTLTVTGGSWDAAMGAWAYRAQLTIGNIAAGSLTDFPLLVQIDTTRFGASFYSQAKAGGADLRFVDPDGTLLAYEIESWNPGGTSYAWVRVPTLTTTGGDFIRMYWGNAAALDAQNADAVWMTSYVGVWHLNGSANDSSGTGNHGTFSGTTATTGVIAGGRDYNGTSDYTAVPNVASLRLTTAMTLEAWIRADSFGAGNDVDALIRMGTDNPNDYQLALLDGRPYFQLEGSDDGSGLTGSLLNTGNWYHVVATLDGSTWSIYVNGTLDASRVQAVTITPDTTRPIFIGGRSGGTDVPDGRLDEVRISNVARSADWIRAQYASMADTLLGYGTPELRPTGVLANDSDPDLDPLTAVLVAGPSHAASFTLNADGSFSYTPLANFNGTDSFTYRANDGSAFSNIATVTITVNAVNDAPTRTAASATLPSVNEDTANPPGATVAALFGPVFSDAADQVTGGSSANALAGIAIEANAANAGTEGRWQYSTNGGTSWINLPAVSTASAFALDTSALLRFLPNANYNGTPGSLTVRLIDDSAGAVVSATFVDVTVSGGTTRYANAANAVTLATSVNAVNDAPHGADNTVNVLEDGSYVFAAGDFGFGDPSDTPANAFLAVRIASLPATGALTNNGVALNVGDFVSEADIALGRLVFTPAANANGTGYASFTFQVQDDGGTASGGIDLDPTPNTLVIDVTLVNDAPAGADNTVSMAEDGTYVFAAPDFGFSDPSDSPANGLAAVRIATLPAQGTLFLLGFGNVVAGQSIGLADLTAGNLRYNPAPDANGLAYASFTFQVRDDGGTANGGTDLDPTPNTLVIDVAPVNDAPVGVADAYAANRDTPLAVAASGVLANDADVDAGDSLTVLSTGTFATTAGGSVTINADGSFVFTPLAGFTGNDTFGYTVRDAAGATGAATVTVTVTANRPPIANDDPAGYYDTVATDASLLSYWRLGEAAGATVASDEGGLVNGAYPAGANKPTLGVGGAIAGDSDTAASFDGNDYVVVAHNAAFASANGTVQLWFNTANPAQRGALLSKDSLGFDTGGHLTIWVDNGRIEVRLQSTSSDYFVRSPVNSVTAGTWHHVAFSFGGDGMRLYLNGLLVASNGYTGGTLGNAEPLVIGAGTVFSGDGTPFPLNDYYTGRIDEVAWFGAQLGAADIQKLYLLGSAAQSYATDQNTVLPIPAASGVLANDLDPDADPLAVVAVNGAGPVGAPVALPSGARVTLNANGSFAYDPNGAFAFLAAGANAVDTFTYTVGDGQGGTASATVTVRIAGLNDAPVASPDAAAVQEDLTLLASGNVLANDTDVDAGDTMTVSEVNGAAANVGAAVAGTYGAVTINADGSYTYTLNNASPLVQALAAGQTVTDAFTYLMRDSAGATSTATLTVTVSGTNDAPLNIAPAAVSGFEDTPFAIGGLSVVDLDVEPLQVRLSVAAGTLSLAPGGATVIAGASGTGTITLSGTVAQLNAALATLVYTGAPDWFGVDTLTMISTDPSNASATDTVTINVAPVNDAPVPGNNSFNIRYGAALVLGTPSLSATDIDDAAGSLVFQVSDVINGRFELVAAPGIAITSFTQAQVMAGQVQFVHNGGGIPSFSLTVTDGALPVGPYAANIVFTGGGDFPAPPSLGGGALFGTPAADSAPTALTVAPIATGGLTPASVTDFLRAPSSAVASISDGDPRFAEADAPAPAGASRAAPGLVTQEPTVVTDQQLSTVRAQSDVPETAAQQAEIEVAPLEGELRISPARAGLDLDDEERQRIEIVLNSIRITGIALSVGAVWWAARAAGLVASLLASTPAWRHVDPLPVLGRDRVEEEDSEWNDPDESPEAKAKRDEEHRAAWVLEGDSRL